MYISLCAQFHNSGTPSYELHIVFIIICSAASNLNNYKCVIHFSKCGHIKWFSTCVHGNGFTSERLAILVLLMILDYQCIVKYYMLKHYYVKLVVYLDFIPLNYTQDFTIATIVCVHVYVVCSVHVCVLLCVVHVCTCYSVCCVCYCVQ